MEYFVYILTNENNTVLYVGVTNDLVRRVQEHRSGILDGFSKKYKTYKLVYFEQTNDVNSAIEREKVLKKWSRKKKEMMISLKNPNWDNLY